MNPFRIFCELGDPVHFTNTNNIIEPNTNRHKEVPGFEKYSTDKTTYKYNENNYPAKIIDGNNVFVYIYYLKCHETTRKKF